MKNRDALKKMLEDIIAGKDEDAQVGFHAFMQEKIKSVIEGCDDDDDDDKDSDSDKDKDDDDDDDSGKPPWLKKKKVDEAYRGRSTPRSSEYNRKFAKAKSSGLYGKKSNKVPTGDWDDKGRGRRGKVSEGEALGSRDKRVKSKVNSFVSKNKAKESASSGLKKTSTKKSRDLDVSSTTDKSKNL